MCGIIESKVTKRIGTREEIIEGMLRQRIWTVGKVDQKLTVAGLAVHTAQCSPTSFTM